MHLSRQGFAAELEVCLQRLDLGENLPDILADYPALADELEPLLLVAMASRALPVLVPGQTARRLGRNLMLEELTARKARGALRSEAQGPLFNRSVSWLSGALHKLGYHRLAFSYRLALVSLVLFLSGGFLTLSASASSQPGDMLYTLKLGMERAGLVWMIDDPELDQGETAFYLPGQSPARSERSIEILRGIEVIQDAAAAQHSGSPAANNAGQGLSGADNLADGLDLAAAEREAARELHQEEKAAAAAEREAEKDLKAEAQAAQAQEREEEKQVKEQDKDAAQQLKEAQEPLPPQSASSSSKNNAKDTHINKPAANNAKDSGRKKSK